MATTVVLLQIFNYFVLPLYSWHMRLQIFIYLNLFVQFLLIVSCRVVSHFSKFSCPQLYILELLYYFKWACNLYIGPQVLEILQARVWLYYNYMKCCASADKIICYTQDKCALIYIAIFDFSEYLAALDPHCRQAQLPWVRLFWGLVDIGLGQARARQSFPSYSCPGICFGGGLGFQVFYIYLLLNAMEA